MRTKGKLTAYALLAVSLAGVNTGCLCCKKKPCKEEPCPGPVITKQPAGQTIADKDSNVTLTVDAKNRPPYETEPVEYQWYFNFKDMPGENKPTLTITKIQPESAGRYFVIVSGDGTAKSCDADILVNEPHSDTTGNGGTLTIGTSSFSIGTPEGTCFPQPPWNRQYAITNGNFVGPNLTTTQPFPNTFGNPTLTIDTCAPINITPTAGLETGIVIVQTMDPLGDKVCATQAGGNCMHSPLLTINQRPVVGSLQYKATVVYKNSTKPAGMTSVKVKWNYP